MQTLAALLAYNNVGLFILRLAVGVVFIRHGWPKLAKTKMMAGGMGKSTAFVFTLGLVETLSGLGQILGIYKQAAALLLALVMLGAIFMKITKWHIPFAAHDKTGWEFDLTLLAANVAILLTGGGNLDII